MTNDFLNEEMRQFLQENEFVYLASSDSAGRPYVVPKFLIKAESDSVYLADFVIGRTVKNFEKNSQASFSIINMDNLIGYQVSGVAEVLKQGEKLDEILRHLHRREMHFSVDRIIEGVQLGKKHEHFEVAFPSRVAVIRMIVEEIVHLSPDGSTYRVSRKNAHLAVA